MLQRRWEPFFNDETEKALRAYGVRRSTDYRHLPLKAFSQPLNATKMEKLKCLKRWKAARDGIFYDSQLVANINHLFCMKKIIKWDDIQNNIDVYNTKHLKKRA